MYTLSDKSYAKFFGEALKEAVLDVMPDMAQNPLDANPVLQNFLHHLSSPMIHPQHMPGKTKNLYDDEFLSEAAPAMAPAQVPPQKPSKQTLLNKKGYKGGIKPQPLSVRDPGKLDFRRKEIERMQNEGRAALEKRGGNPFEHMRRGFHAAFNVDPQTGAEGPPEDPAITNQKLRDSKRAYTNFLIQRGKLAPETAKGSNLFGENHKTLSSAGVGYKTIGISMAPSHHSGYKHDMCPNSSKECRENCLGMKAGGNRQFPFDTLRAKILRTHFIHEHPEEAARLMHHEISQNEKAAHAIGYKSGIRMNVTSDVPYEHLMPRKFFSSHQDSADKPGSQFYDYTKMHGRLGHKDIPPNYFVSLSHTGTGHGESNDKQAVKHLNNGGVVSMVYQRGHNVPHPTHVEDVQSGKRWKIANGDNDDNVFDRHAAAGVQPGEGVVSGLALKGVSNQQAGHFANKVDPDGIIRINRPQQQQQFNILK